MSFDPNSPKSLAQAEAISAGLRVLTSVDRARISMACGTGKTLVQIRVAEGLVEAARSRSSGHQRIVVHVPTLALVRQNLDEWRAHNTWGDNFNWIAVCSDEAVNGKSKAAKSRQARYVPGDDDVFFDAGELAELGQPVNATEESEHHRIKQFLGAAASNPDAVSVIFTTYQSASVVGDALKELEQETGVSQGFDVGVFDEAHKTAGSDPQRKFAYSLRDENLLIKKRVFYTATERVLNFGDDVKEGEARSVIAMDDESLYGPRAYNLSFREAAELGIVAPYEVVVSVINDNEFDGQLDGQGAVDAEGSVYDARSIATMTAVRRAMEEMGLRKGIGFHSRIKLAKDFAEMRPAIEQARMDETTGFEQLHIDSSMSGEARREVMQSYADPGKRSFINNAKCLTEGVNVTETDLVAFIDPKRSKTDIVQAIGRAVRLHDGKTAGRVLLPLHVSISEGETLQEALDRSSGDFKQIRDVLEALAESDDVMKEKIRLLSSRGTGEGQGELPNEANPLAGIVSVRMSGFTAGQVLGIDGESLASAIKTRIFEAVVGDWLKRLEDWKSFNATQGREPSIFKAKDPYEKSLGSWAANQRVAFKQDKMSAERIKLLREAGFVLETIDRDFQWQEAFEGWKSFAATHGREPSFRAKDPYEKSLGLWVGTQRAVFKQGKMSDERNQLLQEAGFILESLNDAKWQEDFEGWKSFKATHGREPSKSAEDPDEKSLGSWVSKQRKVFKQGKMSAERIQLLQESGFIWDQWLVQWQEAFDGWKSFRAMHGREPSSTSKLGRWVSMQRKVFKRGKMPIDRIALLYAAGFTFPGFSEADKARVDAYLASNPLPPGDIDDQVSPIEPIAGIETALPKIDSAPIKEKKKMPSAKELSTAVGYFQALDDRNQGMPVVERNGNFRAPAVQSKFRQIVLSAYGGTCPITGDGENLEAAHLNRPGTDYSTAGGNEYGMLLAGHLHDWYDRGAITIDLEQDPATGKCFGVLSFDQDALNRNPSLAHYSHVKRIPIVKLLDPRTWPNQASAQDMDLAMKQRARRTEFSTRTQDMLEAVQAAVKTIPREEGRLRQVGG